MRCKRSGVRFPASPLEFQRLINSCFDMAEVPLKRRKSSIQPTNQSTIFMNKGFSWCSELSRAQFINTSIMFMNKGTECLSFLWFQIWFYPTLLFQARRMDWVDRRRCHPMSRSARPRGLTPRAQTSTCTPPRVIICKSFNVAYNNLHYITL